MQAVIVEEFGAPEKLRYGELPNPAPGPTDVIVQIRAAAVNYVDQLVISGTYQFLPERPFAPGKLPAGEIVAVGSEVRERRIGERVLTLAEHGGYAELIGVKAEQCIPLPEGVSFIDAAALALASDTAWMALRERARLRPDESVLVLGATGSVGLAAIRLAKAFGAVVLAGISNRAQETLVRDAGADRVIDLAADDLRENLRAQVYAEMTGQGVDIALDMLGGDYFAAAIRALAWRGRLVVVGFASGEIPSLKLNYLLLKNIEVSGLQISDYRKRTPQLMRECFAEIFALAEAGRLPPGPVVTYPLAEYARALADLKSRTTRHRIVLVPTDAGQLNPSV